jgi:hypothetical protein
MRTAKENRPAVAGRHSTPFFNRGSSEHFFSTKPDRSPFFQKSSISIIQPKFAIGQTNDKYEKGADAIAHKVVSSSEPTLQAKCDDCEKEESLQKKSLSEEVELQMKSLTKSQNVINNRQLSNGDAVEELKPGKLPSKIGDGHDLKSAEFAKNITLESVYDNERYLSNGSSGDGVILLQKALIKYGHLLPEFGADGIFGFETRGAVISFQAEHQLTVDGIVGPETIGHLDSMNMGATPPGAVTDCCSDSKTSGLDNGDIAGVICCNKVKHACLWSSGGATGATDATAVAIVDHCGVVHEYAHFDDIDCPSGAGPHRPSFKAGKDAGTEEKKSYAVEKKCLEKMIGKCGTNSDCIKQVKKELAHVTANT